MEKVSRSRSPVGLWKDFELDKLQTRRTWSGTGKSSFQPLLRYNRRGEVDSLHSDWPKRKVRIELHIAYEIERGKENWVSWLGFFPCCCQVFGNWINNRQHDLLAWVGIAQLHRSFLSFPEITDSTGDLSRITSLPPDTLAAASPLLLGKTVCK